MQGVGCADALLYFKYPTTKQMGCPVNVYEPMPADLRQPAGLLRHVI